jgi:hypothetical protein
MKTEDIFSQFRGRQRKVKDRRLISAGFEVSISMPTVSPYIIRTAALWKRRRKGT